MSLGFGTNIRVFRLNDYDFGEGVVPATVSYATLPQFIYGIASTASETLLPQADSQPYNFLNLDVYAQDTWKIHENADLDFRPPRDAQFERLPVNPFSRCGSTAAGIVGRNFAQFRSTARRVDQDKAGEYFRIRTPPAIMQPRIARSAWRAASKIVLRTGFRFIQRHSAGEAWWI